MRLWRKFSRRSHALYWLLIVSLLLQLLLLNHFHLHHVDAPGQHGHHHLIDHHTVGDIHKSDMLAHQDSSDFKSIPGGIIKTNQDSDQVLSLAVFLIFLLPAILPVISKNWSPPKYRGFTRHYYGLAPPLRAPPLV